MPVLTDAALQAERAANDAVLRAIRAVPPERVGRAKAALIEACLLLILTPRIAAHTQRNLLSQIHAVLPDLAGVIDEPIWPVVGAAAVLAGALPGYQQHSAQEMLQLCLMDYYRPRAQASFARWQGQAGVDGKTGATSPEQDQVID